jgi:hypothetical protein
MRPVLLSSLIDAPAEELAGALAADASRCCLRDWLALVPDAVSETARRRGGVRGTSAPVPWSCVWSREFRIICLAF